MIIPRCRSVKTLNFTLSAFSSLCSAFSSLQSYFDLGPPVPLGASGDEKPPSITVTGDPVGSMPANTHLFQVPGLL